MATTKIAPGQVIETLTRPELVHELDRYTANWFQEKARGVTTFRANATDTVSGGAVTLPGPNEDILGPNAGFVWVVQSLRIFGLLSGDSVTVYRNSTGPQNFIYTLTGANPVVHFGSKSLIVKGDEKLIITGTSLMATGDLTVNTEGLECAEPDLYKLV